MPLESRKPSVENFFLWMLGVQGIKNVDPYVASPMVEQQARTRLHDDQNVMMRILLNETVKPASVQAVRDTAALQEVTASLKT